MANTLSCLAPGWLCSMASQMNFRDDDHAKSRMRWALNRQVLLPLGLSVRFSLARASWGVTTNTGVAVLAWAKRWRCTLVSTSLALVNSPVAETICPSGTVMATS